MRIALGGAPGALADGVARHLEKDGHGVERVQTGTPVSRDGKDSQSGGGASRMRQALHGARVLVHVSSADARTSRLPGGFHEALAPLDGLLATASAAANAIERVVVVSPSSIYGEGSYTCPVNGLVTPQWRRESELRARRWEHCCPICNEQLVPVATSENHPATPLSGSGLLVYVQERLVTLWAMERRIPVVALRYFEMYGGELSGPVGLLAARALDGLPLEMSEDGRQTRDYIHQEDVLRVISRAVQAPCNDSLVVNIGTGLPTSAASLVACLEKALGKPLRVRYSQRFERSEPRHLYSATAEMERLGERATIRLPEGLRQFLGAIDAVKYKVAR